MPCVPGPAITWTFELPRICALTTVQTIDFCPNTLRDGRDIERGITGTHCELLRHGSLIDSFLP